MLSSPDRTIIDAAARLAATGDYKGAMALLGQKIGDPPDRDALLLCGKIEAQRGRYPKAIGFWEQVLRLDPNNREAEAGAKKACQYLRQKRKPLSSFKAGRIPFAAALCIVCLMAGGFIAGKATSGKQPAAISRNAHDASAAIAVNRHTDSAAQSAASASAVPEPAFGCLLRKTNGFYSYIPEKGLFRSGKSFNEKADSILTSLGNSLRHQKSCRILIEGHTDSRPVLANSRYRGNRDLALARAERIAEYLIDRAGFPPEQIVIAAGQKAPFSEEEPEGLGKNRTAIVSLLF